MLYRDIRENDALAFGPLVPFNDAPRAGDHEVGVGQLELESDAVDRRARLEDAVNAKAAAADARCARDVWTPVNVLVQQQIYGEPIVNSSLLRGHLSQGHIHDDNLLLARESLAGDVTVPRALPQKRPPVAACFALRSRLVSEAKVPESRSIDPLIGQTIGQSYELVELLGQGGMAVVYRGRHVLTDQDVAVKILPPDLAQQPDVRERFIAEARTLARLEHPNIVGLYNFLQESGHLYIVMQFAEGETFDRIIAREGRVSVPDVVAVGIGTLEALCYAHEREVIHRDIKPSNIVIRGDGAIKVMDFGIAKILGSTKLTQTGQTMGTVRYMSPEQVRGKNVDGRSDLYSLGVTLYEACTGRPPFDGETHFDIMHKHLSTVPRRAAELVELPRPLDEVLARALRKQPAERFQSAAEFRDALHAVPCDERGRRITASTAPISERADQAKTPASGAPARRGGHAQAPDRRVGPRVSPGLVALLMLLTAAGAVVWAILTEDASSRPRKKERAPPGQLRGQEAVTWLEPHRLAVRHPWRVDRRFEADRLRVLTDDAADVERFARIYRNIGERYREFLRDEGLDVPVQSVPLTLAVVPTHIFAQQAGWVSPRYDAPTSTLYVDGGRARFEETDLPYGVALHVCVRISELSSERCTELAEGFERDLKRESEL